MNTEIIIAIIGAVLAVWSEFIDTSDLIVGLLVDEVVIGELVTDE